MIRKHKAFNIIDWLEFRNGRASCPCCETEKGKPNSNLSLVPGSNDAYKCHAGHTPTEIRAVLGAPTPQRPSGLSDPLPSLNVKRSQLVSDRPKKDYTVDESYVCHSTERLLHHQGEPQRQALTWLEGRGFTRQMMKHYQLGLEQLTVRPDRNALEKETYWAIAIFIPVPNQPGRYYKKMRVAPWLTGDARPAHLNRWSQFGVPATIWLTYKPEDATQTWFVEGEWDAMRLGWIADNQGGKVAIACSTGGCGTVPPKEHLERLPGDVVVFYDRNDPLNLHTGSRPGDEGAQKLARALGERGRVGLVPMPENCEVPGWDVSNALDQGFSWEDFAHSAAAATVAASNVTGDNIFGSDSHNQLQMDISATVTAVTAVIERGLPDWEEQAHLDALQSQSVISKTSFWQLVASIRCQSDEVMLSDEQQLSQLIEWKNALLDFTTVLPHLANDLLHDGRVLNIDPVMIWQYLLPATLSLVGKKVDLDVGSHKVPAIAWTCSVGESGTGKSRAEALVLSQLKAWQEAEHNRFKLEWAEHKQLQTKKSEENGDVVPPVPERKFLFETATIQAVMKRLSEQGENGSLWARDEIAGLFKSLGQFTSKGEGEGLECLLPMWDGSSGAVDRVLHEDSYYLASSRLGISGGIQPGVFRKIFTDPDDAQGLQARFLFALPKVQSAKRVKGYCRLADKLPQFYSWVATQFPAGTIKLSKAADARYDAVYEQIGQQAEQAETPAVRAWMRKLPGQLLRIALALHIIECYHEKERSRHELQLDTLNRAVDFCRYYRSAFAITQQTATDNDSISSILIKIWDMAATTPSGLAVRDAYRGVKALQRRAKELGRNVGAYTLDLYYQLEKMGKGVVQRQGRLVRFVTGTESLVFTPLSDRTDAVTRGTNTETHLEQGLQVAYLSEVSPVTEQDVRRVDTITNNDIEQDLSSHIAAKTSENSPPTSDEPDDAPPCRNGVLPEPEPDGSLQSGETELLSPIGVCAQVSSSIIPKQSAGVTETLQSNQFTDSNAVTSFQPEFQTRGGTTNPAATQLQRLTTAQNLAAQILLCQTWVELAEVVGQSTGELLVAAKQMTKQQRLGLKNLLAIHLCSNPAGLGQLAWVPEQLLERALSCLSFTIRRIGGAANVLDACLESISGCKFISVKHLGTRNEIWVFHSHEGDRLAVFGTDAVEAIACDAG